MDNLAPSARSALDRIIEKLFDMGAIKIESEGKYSFKRHEEEPDAPLSPIYFNLRTPDNPKPGPLTPEIIREISTGLWCLAGRNSILYDVVGGIPNAGEPFAEKFIDFMWSVMRSYITSISFVKENTPYGRRISGLKQGIVLPQYERKLLLLDDVLEGAVTKIEATGVAEDNEFEVTGILTVVHYDYEGADASSILEGMGYRFASLFKVSEITEHCYLTRRITEDQYNAGMNFLKSR